MDSIKFEIECKKACPDIDKLLMRLIYNRFHYRYGNNYYYYNEKLIIILITLKSILNEQLNSVFLSPDEYWLEYNIDSLQKVRGKIKLHIRNIDRLVTYFQYLQKCELNKQ